MEVTLAEPGRTINQTPAGQALQVIGVYPELSAGVEAQLTRGEPITLGRSAVDEPVTNAWMPEDATQSTLLSAIEAIQGGRLTPPHDLAPLLTRALAAKEARRSEDVTAWSQRLADEAARADS